MDYWNDVMVHFGIGDYGNIGMMDYWINGK